MTAHVAAPQALAVRSSGDRAFLADLGSLEAAAGLRHELEVHPPAGIADVVAAATTVLVVAEAPRFVEPLIRHVRSLDLRDTSGATGRLLEIPVLYDGVDLADVATFLGLSPAAVVDWHSSAEWTAAFTGFAPGFVYLVSDSDVRVPRRRSPRTSVPPGSVALADAYSSVYPRSSPGGWQLIGSTNAALWDERRADPALIHPGDRVRFLPVRELSRALAPEADEVVADDADAAQPALFVVDSGVSATIQDRGRPGRASLGVGPSGGADRGALTRANRLVGNEPGAAAVEVLGAGFRVRAAADQVLAVTGAASVLTVRSPAGQRAAASRTPATDQAFVLLSGEELTITAAERGVWSYLAIRGGVDVPPVLGSRSRDAHSGLGPAPLEAGASIPSHPAAVSAITAHPLPPAEPRDAVVELRVLCGPRTDWFTPESIDRFFSDVWTVSHQLSRTASRLLGAPLERAVVDELQSEGLVRGSVQVPTDGHPLIFGADHPVTGGYPVIGVVVSADLDVAAQLEPGRPVRFVRAETVATDACETDRKAET